MMILGVFVWFTLPMASAALYPNLQSVFPHLRSPAEGSFFAIAKETFPAGMLGLLVSGVFAATMSAMDAGLNNNAGIFIKNFYQPVIRPDATDKELLVTGKFTTAVLGCIVIGLSVSYSHLRTLSLFQLMLNFGIYVSLPPSMPLMLCLLSLKDPLAGPAGQPVLVGFSDRTIDCEIPYTRTGG